MTHGNGASPIIYTRKMIAGAIGVKPRLLRVWQTHRNPQLFKLPDNGQHPYHKSQVLQALEKVHRRTHGVPPLAEVPERFYTRCELERHYSLSHYTIQKWLAKGCPCFIFSYQVIRYLPSEIDTWYVQCHGKPAGMGRA